MEAQPKQGQINQAGRPPSGRHGEGHNLAGRPRSVRHADGMDLENCEPAPQDRCAELRQLLQPPKPKKQPFYDSAKDRCPGKANRHVSLQIAHVTKDAVFHLVDILLAR